MCQFWIYRDGTGRDGQERAGKGRSTRPHQQQTQKKTPPQPRTELKMTSKRLSSLNPITEAQFQQQIIDLAKLHGYTLIYHTHDSRRSQPGFPDLVLIGNGRALFRELKTGTGRMTQAQFSWIAGMQMAKLNADVWRPADLESGLVIKQLRGEA